MTVLGVLHKAAARRRVEFIVCGGYAVNAYQVIRKTGDIDLVVRTRDAAAWKEILGTCGYAPVQDSNAFLQFQAPTASAWPVDLILVNDRTFDGMKSAAREFPFAGVPCLSPSVEHLIAMKLHALKHTGERRMRKDGIDIVELAERHGIDLQGKTFRQLCNRFADSQIYERILIYAGRS